MPKNLKTLYLYAPQTPDLESSFSGDRAILKLFKSLFEDMGYDVVMPSPFFAKDREGDPTFQTHAIESAAHEVARVIEAYEAPDLFVTYHHYYRAPDLLGPSLVKAWGCPYMIIESSHAPKREHGPWALYYQKTLEAFEAATTLLTINPGDAPMLTASAYGDKVVTFKPFLSELPKTRRPRQSLANEYGLDAEKPWLLIVAQMRWRHKLPSYRFLAEALKDIDLAFELLIIGEGEARAEIEEAYEGVPAHFLGEIPQPELFDFYEASDLLPWPGVNEAIGMCYLEAQAFGCIPVMMAESGGRFVIEPGKTGLVAENKAEFTAHITKLIQDARLCAKMSEAARKYISEHHSLKKALSAMEVICSSNLATENGLETSA